MSYLGLSGLISDVSGFIKTVKSIEDGQTPVHLTGVSATAAAHLVFCLQEKMREKGRVFVVTPDGFTAKKI